MTTEQTIALGHLYLAAEGIGRVARACGLKVARTERLQTMLAEDERAQAALHPLRGLIGRRLFA